MTRNPKRIILEPDQEFVLVNFWIFSASLTIAQGNQGKTCMCVLSLFNVLYANNCERIEGLIFQKNIFYKAGSTF